MQYFIKTLLATGLLAISAQVYAQATTDTATANISAAERAKIEEIVHQYLIRKPEVLVEALQILQQRQMEQAQQTVKSTQQSANTFANDLFHQPNDPVGGNPTGKITVVEFFDYQCPHCVDMAPVIDAVVKANPDIRVIYKEFPIRGAVSTAAARAALAANKQGKYDQLRDALLDASKKELLTNEASVIDIATKIGLDVNKLQKDMTDGSIEQQLKANKKLAQDLKLLGTPAFFVGKTDGKGNISYIPGRVDQKQLQDVIDKTK